MLNLGPKAKFVEEKFYPPFQLRGGAAYRYDADWLMGNVILATDAVFPNDGTAKLHMGMEYNYRTLLSVRAGYKSNYDVQGPTLGFGVAYRNLKFDYAFMPVEDVFGDSSPVLAQRILERLVESERQSPFPYLEKREVPLPVSEYHEGPLSEALDARVVDMPRDERVVPPAEERVAAPWRGAFSRRARSSSP